MSGGGDGLYRHGGASDSTNLDVIMDFDERQLMVQLNHWNLINRKSFILYHHSPVNVNVLMYPKAGPVPEAPVAPLPAGIDMLFD